MYVRRVSKYYLLKHLNTLLAFHDLYYDGWLLLHALYFLPNPIYINEFQWSIAILWNHSRETMNTVDTYVPIPQTKLFFIFPHIHQDKKEKKKLNMYSKFWKPKNPKWFKIWSKLLQQWWGFMSARESTVEL